MFKYDEYVTSLFTCLISIKPECRRPGPPSKPTSASTPAAVAAASLAALSSCARMAFAAVGVRLFERRLVAPPERQDPTRWWE